MLLRFSNAFPLVKMEPGSRRFNKEVRLYLFSGANWDLCVSNEKHLKPLFNRQCHDDDKALSLVKLQREQESAFKSNHQALSPTIFACLKPFVAQDLYRPVRLIL